MQNLSYENDFDLHKNEIAGRTHFPMNAASSKRSVMAQHGSKKAGYVVFRAERQLTKRLEEANTKTRFHREAKDNSEIAY